MSRYLILVLLNSPLIIAGLLYTLIEYKNGKFTFRKYVFNTAVWIFILICLACAQPIYQFLYSNKLTQTEPLSLFDVIQITGIIFVLFMANRSRIKVESLERRLQDLHQELSIRLSSEDNPDNKTKSNIS